MKGGRACCDFGSYDDAPTGLACCDDCRAQLEDFRDWLNNPERRVREQSERA